MRAQALRLAEPRPRRVTPWLPVPEAGVLVRVYPDGGLLLRNMLATGGAEPPNIAYEALETGDDDALLDGVRRALRRARVQT